jgi:SCY1-like protein 1
MAPPPPSAVSASRLQQPLGVRACVCVCDRGERACAQIWVMNEGTSRADGAPVSVFRPSPTAKESHKALAAGGARKLRVIRHPHVLSYVHAMDDGAAPAAQFVALVTEPVVPLRTWLAGVHGRSWEDAVARGGWTDGGGGSSAGAAEACAYGLWCIGTALEFLHAECGLVHGNVCVDTVFVTRGGDWRLGGVELIGDRGAWPSSALRDARAAGALEAPLLPPEVESGDWKAVTAGAVHAADAFLFGVLALQALVDPSIATPAGLRRAGAPPALRGVLARALGAGSATRPTLAAVLATPFFAVPLVSTIAFLGGIALAEAPACAAFFEGLPALLPRFPPDTCLYKILPALISVAEFGSVGGSSTAAAADAASAAAGASAAAAGGASGAAAMAGIVLPSIIAIRGRVPVDEFNSRVGGCVVRLFASPERATRVALLTHIEALLPAVDDKVLNGGLFEQWAAGLTDASSVLRELTVRSIVTLAPRLSAGNVDPKLLRLLRKTLVDADPTVRVNATICVGRVCELLAKPRQDDFVLPALARGLRDPYPQSRTVAVRALSYVLPQFDVVVVAQKLLPAICPATLDDADDVRDAALTLAAACVEKLRKASAERPARPAAPAAVPGSLGATPASAAAAGASTPTPAQQPSSGAAAALASSAAAAAAASSARPSVASDKYQYGEEEDSSAAWGDDDWGDTVHVKVVKPPAADAAPAAKPPLGGASKGASSRTSTTATTTAPSARNGGGDAAAAAAGARDFDDDDYETPVRAAAAAPAAPVKAPVTVAAAIAPGAAGATPAASSGAAKAAGGLKLRGSAAAPAAASATPKLAAAAVVAAPAAPVAAAKQAASVLGAGNDWDEWGGGDDAAVEAPSAARADSRATAAAAPAVVVAPASTPAAPVAASVSAHGGGGAKGVAAAGAGAGAGASGWGEWDDVAAGTAPAATSSTRVPAAAAAAAGSGSPAALPPRGRGPVGGKPAASAAAPVAAPVAPIPTSTAAKPLAPAAAAGWDWGDDARLPAKAPAAAAAAAASSAVPSAAAAAARAAAAPKAATAAAPKAAATAAVPSAAATAAPASPARPAAAAVAAAAAAAPVRAAPAPAPATVVATAAPSRVPLEGLDEKKAAKALGAKKVVVADDWDKW